MPQPSKREPESDQERFDATVKQLLATPPRPNGAKKRPRKRKPAAKPKKG